MSLPVLLLVIKILFFTLRTDHPQQSTTLSLPWEIHMAFEPVTDYQECMSISVVVYSLEDDSSGNQGFKLYQM